MTNLAKETLDDASTDARSNTHWYKYSLVLLVACVLMGAYCCQLNQQLYQHHHPFYDSLSYNEQMFRVMTVSNEQGLFSGLHTACFSNSTNCLPFVIGAVIAPAVSPSRLVGVWIQAGFLFLLLNSLFYYLARIRAIQPLAALAGCLAFLGVHCLFRENGGVSDFRMDLLLFLTFGTTCLWYLISMAKPTFQHFTLLGIAAAACCLCRATAPVYLAFALVPLSLFDLAVGDQKIEKAKGLGRSALMVAVLAGWFFVLNFEYLKFYYVDWNIDANAKLPLSEALKHLNMVMISIGDPLVLAVIAWSLLICFARTDKNWFLNVWREYDLRIAWLGLAPVVMLVARGAGLNPFVSMPAVFGIALFFILPISTQVGGIKGWKFSAINLAVLLLVVSMAAKDGWKKHASTDFNTMQAQLRLADTLREDALSRGEEELTYGVMQLNDLNARSLYSTLMFDCPGAVRHLDRMTIDSVDFKNDMLFGIAAPYTWQHTQGETDEEKLAWLVDQAGERIDYLIVPDQASAASIQEKFAHNYINQFLVPLRKMIVADSAWVKVGDTIQTDDEEAVEIYRKVRQEPAASVAQLPATLQR